MNQSENYPALIASLEALYVPCVEKTDTMEFLHAFGEYMKYLDSHAIFKSLIESARIKHAKEGGELTSASIMGKYDPFDVDMISEDMGKKYPTYAYDKLKKYNLYWKAVSHLKTEKEVREAHIILTEKYESRESHGVAIGAILTMQTEQFKKDLALIHTKFITDLMWLSEHNGISPDLSYDAKKGILYFDGNEISINERATLTNAHYLLTYVFLNNPFEQHFYTEMEDEKALLEEKGWKSYYDACENIQRKVLLATQIPDLLIYSSGKKLFVQVNQKYKTESYP